MSEPYDVEESLRVGGLYLHPNWPGTNIPMDRRQLCGSAHGEFLKMTREIERLTRENERLEAKWRLEGDAYIEAKDEIERLRAALEKLVKLRNDVETNKVHFPAWAIECSTVWREAREALGEPKP